MIYAGNLVYLHLSSLVTVIVNVMIHVIRTTDLNISSQYKQPLAALFRSGWTMYKLE